jgi:arylsulfatase A-like enzyme
MIGELLDALRARPTYADEDWLLLITTDHGHKPGGNHGGATLEERSAYVIASGSDIPAGTVRDDVRHVDIAPSVLAHAGVKIDPAWELDGRPVQELLGA